VLADLMNDLDAAGQTAVDGGDLGRPVTADATKQVWANMGSWLPLARGRELVEQRRYVARIDGKPIGHVEVNVMRAIAPTHNAINRVCGIVEPFAVLGNAIVAKEYRGQGVGKQLAPQVFASVFALPSSPSGSPSKPAPCEAFLPECRVH